MSAKMFDWFKNLASWITEKNLTWCKDIGNQSVGNNSFAGRKRKPIRQNQDLTGNGVSSTGVYGGQDDPFFGNFNGVFQNIEDGFQDTKHMSSFAPSQLIWSQDKEVHSLGEFSVAVTMPNRHGSQVLSGSRMTFVGLFDSHGVSEVSSYFSQNMFTVLTNCIGRTQEVCLQSIQSAVSTISSELPHRTSFGCLIGLIWRGEIHVFNVGLSGAVLGVSEKPGIWKAEKLSPDHTFQDGCTVTLKPHFRFIIVATNTFWAVVENQEAINLVAKGPNVGIAKLLVEKAVKRAHFCGKDDDMTVIVILLEFALVGNERLCDISVDSCVDEIVPPYDFSVFDSLPVLKPIWSRDEEVHSLGEFCIAVTRGSVFSQHSQIFSGNGMTFIGLYDSPEDPEWSAHFSDNMFKVLTDRIKEIGGLSKNTITLAMTTTQTPLKNMAKDCLSSILWKGWLYTGNWGEAKAVFGVENELGFFIAKEITGGHPFLTGYKTRLKPKHRFIIFGTKAFWAKIQHHEAVSIVAQFPRKGIAKLLVQKVLQELPKGHNTNITVIVVFIDFGLIGKEKDSEVFLYGHVSQVVPPYDLGFLNGLQISDAEV